MIHINKFYTIIHTIQGGGKMKSRILAMALALTMVLGSTCTVFADTTINQDTAEDSRKADVVVTYEVTDTYTVTIPADTTIGSDYQNTGIVSASDVVIGENETLKVTLSSTNQFKLKYGNSEVAYSIKAASTTTESGVDKDTLENNDTVLSVSPSSTAAKAAGSTTLTFKTSETEVAKASKAGNHTDKLTFTVFVASDAQ
jgi:hypothetical protein